MREPELTSNVLIRELPKPDRTKVVLPAQLLAKLTRSGVGPRVTAERFAGQYSNFFGATFIPSRIPSSVAMAFRSRNQPESRRTRSVMRWRWQVDLYVPPPPSIRKIDLTTKKPLQERSARALSPQSAGRTLRA